MVLKSFISCTIILLIFQVGIAAIETNKQCLQTNLEFSGANHCELKGVLLGEISNDTTYLITHASQYDLVVPGRFDVVGRYQVDIG